MSRSFVSYAQNHEDVVLWRALRHVPSGRYIDVGANDPRADSVTRAFYDRGWRGITVEPMHDYAERHRLERPGDTLIEAAVTMTSDETITLHQFDNTGLSTTVAAISDHHQHAGLVPQEIIVPTRRLDDILESAGWVGKDIHFMTIDVEGAEADVLASLDLKVWRPWILVIETAAPEIMSTVDGPVRPDVSHADWDTLVLSADYQFCLFDGVSRFYVAAEHAERLGHDLAYPACVLDNFIPIEAKDALTERDQYLDEVRTMTDDAVYWRTAALTRWADALAASNPSGGHEIHLLNGEIAALKNTISWRVTAPLRALRSVRRSRSPLS